MELSNFFKENPKVALAFSGGVDSAYLLYAALKYGTDVQPYYVKSQFQPQFEMEDAQRFSMEHHAKMKILSVDVLSNSQVVQNPANRCYHCKKSIFSTIAAAAENDGYTVLIDGTNASDDAADRPGMQALKELEVRSPLREYGLTKDEIRRRSNQACLFTWDKPAYACLATRIPNGTPITNKALKATESAENYLFALGFTNFRIRMLNGAARIQLPDSQLEHLIKDRKKIVKELKQYYNEVLLDLEVRSE